jgi:tRNA(Ile)-lysidine synthase
MDSVVLLDILVRLGYRNLVVCHLNHGLRGRDSGGDARSVRALARRYGLGCTVARTDVARLAAASGTSLETAGRDARLGFFAEVARAQRCPRVFLAHHADDQVETVLMQLFRGSAGVPRGMAEATWHGPLELLRPLLGVWGDELATYAATHGLRWREDASNASTSPARNRVRHQLLPAASRAFGRDVRAAVWRAAAAAAEDRALLDAVTGAALESCAATDGALSVAQLRLLEPVLRRHVLHRWLAGRGVPGLTWDHVARVAALVPPGAPTAATNLPGDRSCRRRGGRLFVG